MLVAPRGGFYTDTDIWDAILRKNLEDYVEEIVKAHVTHCFYVMCYKAEDMQVLLAASLDVRGKPLKVHSFSDRQVAVRIVRILPEIGDESLGTIWRSQGI